MRRARGVRRPRAGGRLRGLALALACFGAGAAGLADPPPAPGTTAPAVGAVCPVAPAGSGAPAIGVDGSVEGVASAAGADSVSAAGSPPPCAPGSHTFTDRAAHFRIDIPDTHAVASSDGSWYVHGWLVDEPTVPDMSIRFLPERSMNAVVAASFPEPATVTPLAFGGAAGARVEAEYRTPEGQPYREAAYLVEARGGVFVLRRYESFDWAPFDAVARSFRLLP